MSTRGSTRTSRARHTPSGSSACTWTCCASRSGPTFQFVPPALVLRRQQVMGPDGMPLYVYFRRGQRRVDPASDGYFWPTSTTPASRLPPNAAATVARPVPQKVLDAKTVVVRPWWLYADYRAPLPSDRIGPEWKQRFPGFQPAPGLLEDASVRVCREEAQTVETGTIYVSGRPSYKKGDALPAGRETPPPNDSGFAKANRGRAVSCLSGTGFASSVECGCGIGLERCLAGAGPQFDPPGFVTPTHCRSGPALPFEGQAKGVSEWPKLWWSEEARRFLGPRSSSTIETSASCSPATRPRSTARSRSSTGS